MTYSYWKTIKKGLFILGEILIAGIVVHYADSNYWFILAPCIEMGRNYLKHRD